MELFSNADVVSARNTRVNNFGDGSSTGRENVEESAKQILEGDGE